MGIPCAAARAMAADLWSPIATSCNPTPGIGRNAPHLVMQAGEKDSIHHVSKAGRAARIGAIERKWPGLPAKPDHGEPFRHHCVLFGPRACELLPCNDGVHQRQCRLAAKASERSRRCFSPMRVVTSD